MNAIRQHHSQDARFQLARGLELWYRAHPLVSTFRSTAAAALVSSRCIPEGGASSSPRMEIKLDPALWRHLPEDIIETILLLHLQSLSTSDLVQFRLLSRYWNHTILSSGVFRPRLHPTRCAPKSVFCTYDDRFVLGLDTKTSKWFRTPLDFLLSHDSQGPKSEPSHPRNVLESLQFITTDGGLLCFSTCNSGQLIICNVITRSWRDVWLPTEIGREECPSHWRNKSGHGNMDEFLVGLAVVGDKGEYKIVVTSMSEHYHPDPGQRTSILYSSVSKAWTKIASAFPGPFLQGAQHNVQPRKSRPNAALTCHGCIYFLLKYEQMHAVGNTWRLLKFDPESECWSNVPLPRSRQRQWTWWHVSLQLLEHQGRLVLLESTSTRWYEFYAMKVSDSSQPTKWVKTLQNLTREMGSYVWHFPPKKRGSYRGLANCLRCVGQGNCLYFVEENFDREPKEMRVLACSCSPGSPTATKVESMELWESVKDHFIHQSRCWIFQPSLTPVV